VTTHLCRHCVALGVFGIMALAGFFQRADGEWQLFNVVVNDAGGAPDISAVLSANEDVGEVAAQLWKEANPAGPVERFDFAD
jgi:hypothetical protein